MASMNWFGVADWGTWSGVLAVKATLLVGLGLLVASVLRKHTARVRRPIWIVVFAGVVILPIATVTAPSWDIPLLPIVGDSFPEAGSAATPFAGTRPLSGTSRRGLPNRTGLSTPENVGVANEVGPGSALTDRGERSLGATLDRVWNSLLFTWALGSVLGFAGIILGLVRYERQLGRAEPVLDRRLRDELGRLRASLGIRRRVRLVESSTVSVPMTGGMVRPVIVLPLAALTWHAERIRVVLLHELIHIRRNDWLIDLIGRMGRAMYWFNPLMWMALRDWRRVCEQGCDALVVTHGTKPSSYAHLLMEFAEEVGRPNRAWTSSLAMAHANSLEERLMAILQPPIKTRRGIATLPLLSVVLTTIVTAAVVIRPVRPPSERRTNESKSFFLQVGDVRTFRGSYRSDADGFVNFVGDYNETGAHVVQKRFDDGLRMVMRASPEVEFDPDTGEIADLEIDSRVMLATELDGVEFQLEVTPDQDGRPSYEFAVNGGPRPFDSQARAWMGTMLSVAEDIRDVQEIRFELMDLNGKISNEKGKRSNLRGKISRIKSQESNLRAKIANNRSDLSISKLYSRYARATSTQTRIRNQIRALRKEDADADVATLEEELAAWHEEELEVAVKRKFQEPLVEARIAVIEEQIVDLDTEGRVAEVEREILALETDERIAEVQAAIEMVEIDDIDSIRSMMASKLDQLRDHLYEDGLRYLSEASFDEESEPVYEVAPDGRSEGAEQTIVLGGGTKEKVQDDWDRYVREFLEEHGIGGPRAERAGTILATSKKIRDRVLKNAKARMKVVNSDQTDAVRERALAQVERVFQRVLVRNLQKLLPKDERDK